MDYYNYDTLYYPSPRLLVEWPQSSFYQPNSESFVPDHGISRIKQEESPNFQSYPYHQQQRSYDALNLSQQQHAHNAPYPAIMLPSYSGVSMIGVNGAVEDLVGNEDAYKEEKWEEVLQRPAGEWRFQSASSQTSLDTYDEPLQGQSDEWGFQSASSQTSLDLYDDVLHGSSGCTKRRRSQSAPIPATSFPVPIPVPNLTKKSRGRRVPTMSSLEDIRSAASGAGRKRQSSGGKTARMYMCEVKGCGKCFARGEHLKRHVRSIHTYEKREVLYPCIQAHIFTIVCAYSS